MPLGGEHRNVLPLPLQAVPGGIELLILLFFSLLFWLVPLVAIVLIVYYLRKISRNVERLVERGE